MGGCYRCGSEDGSDSQLCPTCAQIRRVERAGLAEGKVPERLRPRSRHKSRARALDRFAFDQKTILVLSCAILTLFLGFRLVMYHLSAPSLTPRRLGILYEKCLVAMREQLKSQVNVMAEGAGAQKDFKDAVTTILGRGISKAGGAEGVCAYLREECKVNPYGGECRSGVKSFLGEDQEDGETEANEDTHKLPDSPNLAKTPS